MKIIFNLNPDALKVKDLIFIEEHVMGMDLSRAKISDLRDILARFVCDENDQRLDAQVAAQEIEELTLNQLIQAAQALTSSVKQVKENAVPLANGNA